MQALVVDGPEPSKDFSYQWVQGHQDLKSIEQAFPITQFQQEFDQRDTDMEFRILRRLTETQYHNENLVDFHPDTQKLNRYNNILPFKHSQVILKVENEEEDLKETYIYANFINSVTTVKHMVATQGPLACTFSHFWKMIEQENISLIVMLCNMKENNKAQCDQYWPKAVGEHMLCGQITIKLESIEEKVISLVNRKITLNNNMKNDEERKITQLHCQGWADQGAPQQQDFDLIFSIVTYIVEQLESGQRVVFHCSAGVGRTGTLIALCNMMMTVRQYLKSVQNDHTKIEQQPDLYKISVFGTVRRLREQRWGMVHTSEQYQYLYKFMEKAIQYYLKRHEF